jgi:hypothetical protein
MYAVPFLLGARHSFQALGINVTVAGSSGGAGAAVRMGVYADNGNGYPGALVLDAGTATTIAIGATIVAFAGALDLIPGLYWLVAVPQNAPTTQATVTANGGLLSPSPIGGVSVTANSTAYATAGAAAPGALPTPFPGGATPVANGAAWLPKIRA